MKLIKKITAAVIALAMVGCNDVPEDVKSRAEEQWKPIAEEHKDMLQHIPYSDMQADVDKALKDSYSNFTLRSGIKVSLPDVLRQCDFVQVKDYSSNAEKILEAFTDGSDRQGVTIETYHQEASPGIPGTATVCRGFRDEEGRKQFIVWDNGFVSMFRGKLFDITDTNPETVKIYHIDRGDDLSDSYKLDKETVTVKDAVDKAQKWIDDRYAQFEPDYKIKIHTVRVIQYIDRSDEENEYVTGTELLFYALKEYKGIRLDFNSPKYENEKNSKITRTIRSVSDIQLRMMTDSNIEMVSNGSGMVKPSEKGTLDNVISLSSALQYIESTFTNFNDKLQIADIQLKYTLYPEYDKETQVYNAPNNTLKGHLVWEFTLALSDSAFEQSRKSHKDFDDFFRYIQIDAETGEMEFSFGNYEPR